MNKVPPSGEGRSLEEANPPCCYADEKTRSPCDGEVTFEPDPYQADVNHDMTPVWMCYLHRGENADDI